MTNISLLRDELILAYDMVKKDPKRAPQVKEMVNAAGKIINSLKVELEYRALRKEAPVISYFES